MKTFAMALILDSRWYKTDLSNEVVVFASGAFITKTFITKSDRWLLHTDANQAADKGSIHRTIYPDKIGCV
ncbi:hypothetical protein [Bartonella quintana]|uniref:hypothetical protein n=1 Tax=Bartonella quintana TaxID=803 RepID=UPI0012495FAF|nr:hypothetical protein [Bartonella quintana]